MSPPCLLITLGSCPPKNNFPSGWVGWSFLGNQGITINNFQQCNLNWKPFYFPNPNVAGLVWREAWKDWKEQGEKKLKCCNRLCDWWHKLIGENLQNFVYFHFHFDFAALFSGLDFAWASNGYVYHTRLDDIHQIPLGSLQRTGDNILPLILRLVNSDYLSNIQAHSKGNLVYFDILGTFIVAGREMLATFINVLIIAASVYALWRNMKYSSGMLQIIKKFRMRDIV